MVPARQRARYRHAHQLLDSGSASGAQARERSSIVPRRPAAVSGEIVDPRVTLNVLAAVKRGDFSARMPASWTGQAGRVAAALNEIIESNQRLERELQRLGRRVGK